MSVNTKEYPGLKLLKDNWEKIRDEIGNNFKNFVDNSEIYTQSDYQSEGWYSRVIISSNNILENNAKKYPLIVDLYNKLDVPNKQSIGITILKKNGFITPHKDPEQAYRYHLCLQAEKDKSLFRTYDTSFSEEFLNPGEDKILDTGTIHSSKNRSLDVDRIDLVVDFLKDKSMVENYQEIFGYGDEWNN